MRPARLRGGCRSCDRPGPPWRMTSSGRSGELRRPRRRRRVQPLRRPPIRKRCGHLVARPLEQPSCAGRPSRLEGKGDPHRPDAVRLRPGRRGARPAGIVRVVVLHRGDRKGAALLGLQLDGGRGHPCLQRRHHARAGLPRPTRPHPVAVLLHRHQPGRLRPRQGARGADAPAPGDTRPGAGALRGQRPLCGAPGRLRPGPRMGRAPDRGLRVDRGVLLRHGWTCDLLAHGSPPVRRGRLPRVPRRAGRDRLGARECARRPPSAAARPRRRADPCSRGPLPGLFRPAEHRTVALGADHLCDRTARGSRAGRPLPGGGGVSGRALEFTGVSRWYGDMVSLADVAFTVEPGVTGLLGHNGAGKSTTLKLCAGFSTPSAGTVRVFGVDPRRTPEVYRRIGIVPDHGAPWPFLTARSVIELSARLHKVSDHRSAAAEALETVDLTGDADRPVREFSHGMTQRVKLAQALVHEPDLLLLDEPLNGLDPTQRAHAIALLTRLGAEGRTVVVSSHVLHEVERMADRVLVLVNGHLVAEGSTPAIRRLISDRPRRVEVTAAGNVRALARELLAGDDVEAVRLADGTLEIETSNPASLSRALPLAATRADTLLELVRPVGDDLESVYAYLHERARGRAR